MRQRNQKFLTYLCYQFGSFCYPFTDNNTVTPATNALITYTFNPIPILQGLKFKMLNVRIRVATYERLIPCNYWRQQLSFVTDGSLGKDKVPLMVTYMKVPETRVLSLFLNEAVKNAPIPAPTAPVPHAELEGRRPRHKRDHPPTSTTPITPTTPIPACRKQTLPIQAGWSLSKEHTFSNTFDIGFCEGHCSEVYTEKTDERAAFVNLARRRGYISPDQYPESCVPEKKDNLTVMIMPQEGVYDIIMLPNLVVKSCTCVV